MINTKKIIISIDIALMTTDNLVENSKFYTNESIVIKNTKKALNLLKESILDDPENINERILRAMRDIGGTAVKTFENTPLENAICNITEELYNEIPRYKELEPLQMDFGKGDPI